MKQLFNEFVFPDKQDAAIDYISTGNIDNFRECCAYKVASNSLFSELLTELCLYIKAADSSIKLFSKQAYKLSTKHYDLVCVRNDERTVKFSIGSQIDWDQKNESAQDILFDIENAYESVRRQNTVTENLYIRPIDKVTVRDITSDTQDFYIPDSLDGINFWYMPF